MHSPTSIIIVASKYSLGSCVVESLETFNDIDNVLTGLLYAGTVATSKLTEAVANDL